MIMWTCCFPLNIGHQPMQLTWLAMLQHTWRSELLNQQKQRGVRDMGSLTNKKRMQIQRLVVLHAVVYHINLYTQIVDIPELNSMKKTITATDAYRAVIQDHNYTTTALQHLLTHTFDSTHNVYTIPLSHNKPYSQESGSMMAPKLVDIKKKKKDTCKYHLMSLCTQLA